MPSTVISTFSKGFNVSESITVPDIVPVGILSREKLTIVICSEITTRPLIVLG